MNEREEQFTSERLEKDVIALQDKPTQEIVAGIMKQIISFAHSVPQSDDITMMVVEFKGSGYKEK